MTAEATAYAWVYVSPVEIVRASGLEIAYERVGDGPPLLFVHGADEDHRSWRSQLAALSDEFTVVCWDEPGAGHSSDVPAGFRLPDYADCLAALIEALGLGPAHVAGLSWGGTIVQELYRRHPRLVATLILADTYAGWKGSLSEKEVRARVASAREMLAAPAEAFDPTLPGLFAGAPPAGASALLADMAAAVRPESLRSRLVAMAEADQRDLLPRIAVPTLLIWGEQDVRSPLRVAHQFEQAIPDATLVVIAGSGHLSNLEKPEQFNDAVRRFCRTRSPGRHSPPMNLVAIGRVESPLTDRESAPRQGDEGAPEAWIVFDAQYADGLDGIAPGDEVLVLTWLDRAAREVLRVRPRGDLTRPVQGVFATRSPDRPNPIGLHRVTVAAVEGLRLRVRHLEALDGTPVVDVKPLLRTVDER